MRQERTLQRPDEVRPGLSDEDLAAEVAFDLPDREALSLAFPLAVATTPVLASKAATVAADPTSDAPVA